MSDYFSVLLLPPLLERLLAHAAQTTLHVIHMPRATMSGGRNNKTAVQDFLDEYLDTLNLRRHVEG